MFLSSLMGLLSRFSLFGDRMDLADDGIVLGPPPKRPPARPAVPDDGGPRPEESVIDDPDWVPVPFLRQKPWCAICLLDCEFEIGPPSKGTGWLVNARMVVTAGHNLWNPETGRVARIKVTPAAWVSPWTAPFGSQFTTHFVFDKRWEDETLGDMRHFYDYGAVFLPSPGFRNVPFYFSYYALAPQHWNRSRHLNCAGYPEPLGYAFVTANGTARDPLFVGADHEMVVHDIDTEAGHSGGPLFWTDGGVYKTLAIHTQGKGLNPDFNTGVRINPTMTAAFDRWGRNPDQYRGAVTVPSVGVS